jgi:glycosyltransferase involved in cell wall biosynthesis
MKKKKVLYHSDPSWSKTGFGRATRAMLTYLYKTGKYDIVEYGMGGCTWDDPRAKRVPWKFRGAIPNSQNELHYLIKPDGSKNEPLERLVYYGFHNIDKIIKEEKPDVYIGIQDIWAFHTYWDKKWWPKINSCIVTTLDSLPILPTAIEVAPKIKNYFVWSKFAEEALHEAGQTHVKTIHGPIDTKIFYKLSQLQRKELRSENNIPEDAFIIGFVFRNQLRKSVHKLLEAFVEFSKRNPKINGYLLLHTFWEEGWDIPRYIKEFNIPNEKVLTTYVCRHCHHYEIKPFTTRDTDCKYCGVKADPRYYNNPFADMRRTGQVTTSTMYGVTEEQLNEVYNFMDVYVHPFTSGGQEIPVQEAKLTELITLVTNYSCGIEYCTPESGGLPLEWDEYREPESQFIKATTKASSILVNLEKVLNMLEQEKVEMGKRAREYVLKHCSVESVGKLYEELIDSLPFIDWDFDWKEPLKNTTYPMQDIPDNLTWIKDLYKNILLMDEGDPGEQYWMKELEAGTTREYIYQYFIQEAKRLNAQNQDFDLEKLFDKDDKGRRVLYVMPQSIGDVFISTSLFKSIKKLYPDYNLYVATKPEYFEVLEGNPYIHKTIPYVESYMCDELRMCGSGKSPGFVNVLYLPFLSTQKYVNYLSKSKLDLELNE